MSRKFLIGQLACYGDCLYATTVAKQIKNDFPNSHITWAVASRYKSILKLNPHVDEIWEIELVNNDYNNAGWRSFEAEAKKRKANGVYDELIFTQLMPGWKNCDGTIRSSTLRGYNRPITVTVDPVVRLSDQEVDNVKTFSEKYNLSSYKDVILFECSPGSGQSFMNFKLAIVVAEKITEMYNDICFILSSPTPINNQNHRIIDASELTYRENAELTKYCTLLIGTSSGITWLSTSDWAKKLNMLQLLNRQFGIFAGIKYDFERWKISTSNVIEVTIKDITHVVNCIKTILEKDFQIAKQQFDEVYKPTYLNFRSVIRLVLYGKRTFKFNRILRITIGHARRNKHFNIFVLIFFAALQVSNFYRIKFSTSAKKLFKFNYFRTTARQSIAEK